MNRLNCIQVTATKIRTPRDLYRIAQSPVQGKDFLYVEKDGRRARAQSVIGLINLNIRPGDHLNVVSTDPRFVGSAAEIGSLLGDVR